MNRHRRRAAGVHVATHMAVQAVGREPAELVKPLMDAYDVLAIELDTMTEGVIAHHMATAAEIIASPEYQAKLKAMVEDQAIAQLRAPAFQKDIETLVKTAVRDIAVDVLAERLKEAQTKIAAIVDRDWDEQVAKVAHDLLDQKLAELRKGINGK